MPIEVEGPDGVVIEFPDGTDQATMQKALRGRYGGPLTDEERVARGGRTRADQQAKVDREAADYQRQVAALDRQEGAGRALGLGGRAILKGLTAIPDLVVSPLTSLVNKALPDSMQQRDLGGMVDYLVEKVGGPTPQTSQERVYSDVMSGITGAAVPVGLGQQMVKQGVSQVTKGVGSMLASQPGLQTVSAATGSGAAGLTREAGGGEGAQLGAAILGGLSPGIGTAIIPRVPSSGIVSHAAKQGIRRVARGGASADDITQAIDEFATAGTTPTVGQATGNRLAQGFETLLGNTPGGAGRMADFAQRQGEQVGSRIDDLAAGLTPRGRTVTQTEAGNAIRSGISGSDPDSLASRAKLVSDRLYAKVDSAMPDDTRVEVGRTREALADLNSIIEGAPSVSRFFQNAKLQGIESGLNSDVGGIEAVLTRPGMRESADAYRQFLKEGAEAAAARNLKRKQLGVPGGEEKVLTDAEIDADVAATLKNMVDDKLPYEALRKLRTLVGNEISDFSLSSDVPRSKWKSLYGALSDDMRSAMSGNPQAEAAWDRANRFHSERVKRMEALDHVIDKNGGPEAVYDAAFGNTKDGATTLRTVMRSLPKDARREMSASFVRRMGRAVGRQQDNESRVFSMESFLTNWANLSSEAKKELFGFFGSDYRTNMDKIAAMASKVRDGSQVFRNPSGTARQTALIGQVAATTSTAAGLAATGNVGLAVMTILGSMSASGSANVFARAMTNPRVVRWIAKNEDRPVAELAAQLNVLSRIGDNNNDAEVSEIADQLRTAIEPDSK